MSEVQASTEEKAQGYQETLATWRVRYLDPSGYECALSLEAETGSEVLKKAEAAIARLVEKKCLPLSPVPSNGKNHSEQTQTNPIAVQGAEGQSKKRCPIHGIEMTLWQKGERRWYSHRWEGRWCKGGAG